MARYTPAPWLARAALPWPTSLRGHIRLWHTIDLSLAAAAAFLIGVAWQRRRPAAVTWTVFLTTLVGYGVCIRLFVPASPSPWAATLPHDARLEDVLYNPRPSLVPYGASTLARARSALTPDAAAREIARRLQDSLEEPVLVLGLAAWQEARFGPGLRDDAWLSTALLRRSPGPTDRAIAVRGSVTTIYCFIWHEPDGCFIERID